MRMDGSTACMRNYCGLGCNRDDIRGSLRVCMTEIHRNSETVHLSHSVSAQRGQAAGIGLQHSGRKLRPAVIRKLHHAHSKITEEFDTLEIALQHLHTFKR